ncbi:Polyketide synthase PksJ [Pseudoalteromonas holothuriae]|uniref:Polyketide synthase PksJ n=2 Tax=Pseudoalteromonas holothuriae TaxID=2963714 RepID=A0ABM9GP41_9GAMM|nr:Polyketide synthase PksJ [Pseudoalteromonas sp. CIP111951]
MAGVIGNVGQTDYAAANGFVDGYLRSRAQRGGAGKSLALAWPLWQAGGMQVDEGGLAALERQGLAAMPTELGLDCFYRALNSSQSQLAFVYGVQRKSERLLNPQEKQPEQATLVDRVYLNDIITLISDIIGTEYESVDADAKFDELGMDIHHLSHLIEQLNVQYESQLVLQDLLDWPTSSALSEYLETLLKQTRNISVASDTHTLDDHGALNAAAVKILKRVVGKRIKLSADLLDETLEFERYGIDSVQSMNITTDLEAIFDTLPKTLFFEYSTIAAMADYFATHYNEQLSDGLEQPRTNAISVPVQPTLSKIPVAAETVRENRFITSEKLQESVRDIAIIGVAGRYPGARNVQQFWDNLKQGIDSVGEVPITRWEADVYFSKDKQQPGKSYSKWGGFIAGVDEFDPVFFGILPKEVTDISPQERLFLECAHHTLEDGGYTRDLLRQQGKVGVFVGVMWEEYQLFSTATRVLSGHPSSIANRVSYFCNFTGPSMAVDTMCSSSLTSIHLACNALVLNECYAAIAGGVNVSIHPNKYVFLAQKQFISSEGLCRSFGLGGDGYVPGEGVGAILLKTLANAEKDNDSIYAVIKGTAINHGGKSNGYTVPDPVAQAQVIQDALQVAGVSPASISYLEAHGTGTSLGDPIEVAGLTKVFANQRESSSVCALGSVKSNIGHLESAAGVAAITKVILQLKHSMLVPSLHSQQLNPNLDLSNTPFVVQQQLAQWQRPTPGQLLRAGISSFGAGGANAHLIVDEYVSRAKVEKEIAGPHLVVLSADSKEQLDQYAHALYEFIIHSEVSDAQLSDIAFTLQTGREARKFRLGVSVYSVAQLSSELSKYTEGTYEDSEILRGQPNQRDGYLNRLFNDEDLKESIANWWQKNKHIKLLELWVNGLNLVWHELYALNNDVKPNRYSGLPNYPFAGELYPIGDGVSTNVAQQPKIPADQHAFLLTKTWQARPLVQVQHNACSVLILCHSSVRGMALELFKNEPSVQCTVTYGFDVAHVQLAQFDGIIDLMALTTKADIDWDERKNTLQTLEIMRSYIRQRSSSQSVLLQVTRGRCEAGMLDGAELVGFYRSVSQEYRAVISASLDVELQSSAQEITDIIEQEFAALPDYKNSEVCYQNVTRKVPEIVGERLALDWQVNVPKNSYRKDDVALISGGARGIGFELVKHLCSQGINKFIIVGREELPDQELWRDISASQDDGFKGKIKALQAVVESGARVYYLGADVVDKKALNAGISLASKALGSITHVYHCAGVMSQPPALLAKSTADIQSVLSSKIQGLYNLHELCESHSLRTFIIFSSVCTELPNLAAGQLDYVMANSYVDEFVRSMSKQGYNYFRALQWPSWSETGMAVGYQTSLPYQDLGLTTLSNSEGFALMSHALSSEHVCCAPCVFNQPPKFSSWSDTEPLLKREPSQKVSVDASRTKSDTDVRAWLFTRFAEEFGLTLSQLDGAKSFAEYGVESVFLAGFSHTLQQFCEVPLSASLLLEHDTLAKLAEYLSLQPMKLTVSEVLSNDDVAPILPISTTIQNVLPNSQKPIDMLIDETSLAEVKGSDDPVIIGMAGKFPQADDIDTFWQQLLTGDSAIRKQQCNAKGESIYGAWLTDKDKFDNEFFGIPYTDACTMDVQARLLLTQALKAVNDAGYSKAQLVSKRVGVFVGARSRTIMASELLGVANPILALGHNYLAANISRYFDVKGPSLVSDAACASAMVNLQHACDALQLGRIDMAIVGTANVFEDLNTQEFFAQRGLLSQSGHYALFSEHSDGKVLGEAVGVVVLKRESDAFRDRDRIYCKVKAIAANNDGQTIGPASPNIDAQRQVISQALKTSQLSADAVSYIEVNGAGSRLLDAIEVSALAKSYQFSQSTAPHYLGSVKPNVGHTLMSSAMVGMIKCALSVYHQQIPPFRQYGELFNEFDFVANKVSFNLETQVLPSSGNGLCAAALNVNADGGSNFHVIFEQCPIQSGAVSKRIRTQLHEKQIDTRLRQSVHTTSKPFTEVNEVNAKSMKPNLDNRQKVQEEQDVLTVWGEMNEE